MPPPHKSAPVAKSNRPSRYAQNTDRKSCVPRQPFNPTASVSMRPAGPPPATPCPPNYRPPDNFIDCSPGEAHVSLPSSSSASESSVAEAEAAVNRSVAEAEAAMKRLGALVMAESRPALDSSEEVNVEPMPSTEAADTPMDDLVEPNPGDRGETEGSSTKRKRQRAAVSAARDPGDADHRPKRATNPYRNAGNGRFTSYGGDTHQQIIKKYRNEVEETPRAEEGAIPASPRGRSIAPSPSPQSARRSMRRSPQRNRDRSRRRRRSTSTSSHRYRNDRRRRRSYSCRRDRKSKRSCSRSRSRYRNVPDPSVPSATGATGSAQPSGSPHIENAQALALMGQILAAIFAPPNYPAFWTREYGWGLSCFIDERNKWNYKDDDGRYFCEVCSCTHGWHY